jgi:hypothetical protein
MKNPNFRGPELYQPPGISQKREDLIFRLDLPVQTHTCPDTQDLPNPWDILGWGPRLHHGASAPASEFPNTSYI